MTKYKLQIYEENLFFRTVKHKHAKEDNENNCGDGVKNKNIHNRKVFLLMLHDINIGNRTQNTHHYIYDNEILHKTLLMI